MRERDCHCAAVRRVFEVGVSKSQEVVMAYSREEVARLVREVVECGLW